MSAQAELAQALAFLYVTFGHATDGTLTQEEMRTLAAKLGTRAPELTLEDLGQVLRSAVSAFMAVPTREARISTAQTHATILRDACDDAMRRAILSDLVEIAKADGQVSDEELAFIDQTAATLGVQREG
ncbi:TerB family tellurite resistance protein [Paraliomyxa miuraensis]|uniref:TerB family tellurite resistance protein n=1 Tax=Paraliomyxa miuraensis TaxID=376150 RepID=UPI00225AA982|nr:TerB family tellurite resistance protein [Paraliomyxa miuraensis]MCX4243564.1 TerB family tellurite resistance protein [Paraliomyxa miuraensis]